MTRALARLLTDGRFIPAGHQDADGQAGKDAGLAAWQQRGGGNA